MGIRIYQTGAPLPGHLVASLYGGTDYRSNAESQREAPERRLEDCQPEADPQRGANQAANPQSFVHSVSSTVGASSTGGRTQVSC
jgi:hypothetical protein